MKRRNFIAASTGVAAGASMLSGPVGAAVSGQRKKRLALVGTGIRGTGFWGKSVIENYGDLENYGINHPYRGSNCRICAYTDKCENYWDITRDEHLMNLYVKNKKYDGYIRDNCLWKENIDIFDKMSVQIKYANNIIVNYSLTTYSLYEGWRIAFNGHDGRIESWEDIPWRRQEKINQAELHAAEMNQNAPGEVRYDEIFKMNNFNREYEIIKIEELTTIKLHPTRGV